MVWRNWKMNKPFTANVYKELNEHCRTESLWCNRIRTVYWLVGARWNCAYTVKATWWLFTVHPFFDIVVPNWLMILWCWFLLPVKEEEREAAMTSTNEVVVAQMVLDFAAKVNPKIAAIYYSDNCFPNWDAWKATMLSEFRIVLSGWCRM